LVEKLELVRVLKLELVRFFFFVLFLRRKEPKDLLGKGLCLQSASVQVFWKKPSVAFSR